MGRPPGPRTRILSVEDRGGRGAKRYRVRYLLDGRQLVEHFATARAKGAFVERFQREAQRTAGATVEQVIDEWLADRRAKRLAANRQYHHWPRAALADYLDQPIGEADFAAGFEALAERVAPATNKLACRILRMFGAWLVTRRYATLNPAADIKPIGTPRKGKPQIETENELSAFRDEAWRRARAGDRLSLGVLMCLYLGMRPGEALKVEARHLDRGQRVTIPGTKNERAHRRAPVLVPELWELMEAAAKGGGLLVPHKSNALLKRAKLLARRAGVSDPQAITAHALRGMAASLAVANDAPFEAIAKGLGHGSFAGMTGEHYATKESQEVARGRAALRVLEGGNSPKEGSSGLGGKRRAHRRRRVYRAYTILRGEPYHHGI